MKADMQKLTDLSMIRTTETETERLTEELGQVLRLADQLHPVQDQGENFPAVGLSALREDASVAEENAESLLAQSNYYRNRFVRVARIVTESC